MRLLFTLLYYDLITCFINQKSSDSESVIFCYNLVFKRDLFTTPFFLNIQYANAYFVDQYLRFDLFNFQFPFDRLAVRA